MEENIVAKLTAKDDKYACALADKIISESQETDEWYEYFDDFASLLDHPKSLVRNRVLHILAANAQWDEENHFDSIISDFLTHIMDEKPITARQCVKALAEAEAYPGPSLIIAYAPCINHGLKAGMGKSQEEEEKAVKCGYWHLWRYNPALEEEGKNPFQLDSKEPNWEDFQGFLKGEVRYASVMKQYPAEAEELFKAAEENAKWRYNSYKRLARENWGADTAE